MTVQLRNLPSLVSADFPSRIRTRLRRLPLMRTRSHGVRRMATWPHVVIVGGGFGGLNVAKGLHDAPARVTLIDQHNYHLFQPLLYQVATASLSPADIASPIRSVLRHQRNARVELAKVDSVDLARKRVVLADGDETYDYLVLAAGAQPAYFGHLDWAAALAPGLKSLDDALDMRSRIFQAFERAERTTDERERRRALTFVVVGGGPTGVELAGAIDEIAHHTLPREFRIIDPHQTRIMLVDGGPRILATFPENLSQSAARDLKRLGVEIRTNTRVTRIELSSIRLGD